MDENINKKNILEALEYFTNKIRETDLDFNTIKNIDYYWDIHDKEKLYDPNKEPENELSIGQISFDWDSINELFDGKREFIGYDFKRLSTIIRLLDKVYNETKNN